MMLSEIVTAILVSGVLLWGTIDNETKMDDQRHQGVSFLVASV